MLDQENRKIQLHITNVTDNSLIPIEYKLTETISKPYTAIITGLLQNLSVTTHDLVGQMATIDLFGLNMQIRRVNGIIHRVKMGKTTGHHLRRIELKLIPTFALLQHDQDCQFFTNLTVIDIFKQYCKKLGFQDYDINAIIKKYPKLPYKAQYNETALTFLSRLLEEAGIFYYFKQENNLTKILLLDDSNNFTDTTITAKLSKQPVDYPVIWKWQNALKMQPRLDCIYPQSLPTAEARQLQNENLKTAWHWQQRVGTAAGNIVQFSAGHTFNINDPTNNMRGSFLITEINHYAYDYSYLPEDTDITLKSVQRLSQGYHNTFHHINLSECRYAPKRSISKPKMPDFQSAIVAAPSDHSSNIYTNKLGCIKVKFPWDRQQKLSHWIQVGQPLGGNAFGAQFIPRLGQEVLVSYISGDCDMPIVIGAAANAAHTPAYNLEKNANRNWIKSKSITTNEINVNENNGNELIFDDTPHKEQFIFHAAHDYYETILHNAISHIEGDDVLHIDGSLLMQVFNDDMTIEGKSITLRGSGNEIHIDAKGIHLRSDAATNAKIYFCSKGAGAEFPITRMTDAYQCQNHLAKVGIHSGKIQNGTTNIMANGLAISGKGDNAVCALGNDSIREGINSILLNGKSIARLSHHLIHGGMITEGSPNVYVKEKPKISDVYQYLQQKPNNYLIIHVCDFYNVDDPMTKKPVMQSTIKSLLCTAIAVLHDDSNYVWCSTSILNGQLRLQGHKPGDIKILKLVFEPTANLQQVNIIAINNHPIAPTDTLILHANDFTQMPMYQDAGKNTCYPMTITLLQPALFFNFRQDNWLGTFDDEDEISYDALKQYYATPKTGAARCDNLTQDEINYFKHNGNNATIFIHGFNIPTGCYAKGFTLKSQKSFLSSKHELQISEFYSTLYRDESTLTSQLRQAFREYAPTLNQQIACLVGEGAHRWLICMEHNLNCAAGLKNNDYRKFTRIIFINWQGNPTRNYDYMAATGFCKFPAKKTMQLIHQLHSEGIKITIMAHSLGCDVLMHTLNMCGNEGIVIDHAILWEAAIPNDAFNTLPRWYFPMVSKKHVDRLNSIMPYSYNYTAAQQGSLAITVLYSARDNIIGPMPTHVSQENFAKTKSCKELIFLFMKHMTIDASYMAGIELNLYIQQEVSDHKIFNTILKKVTPTAWVFTSKTFPSSISATTQIHSMHDSHLTELSEKIIDPGAGITYAIISDIIDRLDEYFVPLAGIHKKLLSAYHIANMFGMPFSYFIDDEKIHCPLFFELWRQSYNGFQAPYQNQFHIIPFAKSFHEQISLFKVYYPKLYGFSEQFKNDLDRVDSLDTALAKLLIIEPDYLITVILLGLLTPDAIPKPALGASGVDPESSFINSEKYHPIPQNHLLPDHSGMLFPTVELFQKIYIDKLMQGKKGEAFNHFGRYTLKK